MDELVLALVVLSLVEGIRWLPLQSAILARTPLGGTALTRPAPLRSGSRKGLAFCAPWLPVRTVFVPRGLPVAVAPGGVYFPASNLEDPGAGRGGTLVPWPGISGVKAVGSTLVAADGARAVLGSDGECRELLNQLQALAALPEEAREDRIRRAIAGRFSERAARGRLRRLRVFLPEAHLSAWLIAANILIVGPALAALAGQAAVWLPWIGCHLILAVQAAAIGGVAGRRLPSFGQGGRLQSALMTVFYPPAALRFVERFSSEAMTGLDPLSAMAELLEPERFRREARRRYALQHPEGNDPEAVRWYKSALREEILSLAERKGVARASVTSPPERDAGSSYFCPRCWTQFARDAGGCRECAGVDLESY